MWILVITYRTLNINLDRLRKYKFMKYLILFFLQTLITNISFATENELSDSDKQILVDNMFNKNCESFHLRYFNTFEISSAAYISENCLKKYYEELVDHSSHLETHKTIMAAIQHKRHDFSLTVFNELLDRFGDTYALDTLNTICLGFQKFEPYNQALGDIYPQHKETTRQLPYCKLITTK